MAMKWTARTLSRYLLVVTACSAAFIGATRLIADPPKQESAGTGAFKNESGWTWASQPAPVGQPISLGKGAVVRLQNSENQEYIIYATPASEAPGIAKVRLVAVDKSGQRLKLMQRGSLNSGSINLQMFVLDRDQTPRQDEFLLGIEELTKDNLRNVVAAGARKALRQGLPSCPTRNWTAPTSSN